MKQILLTAAIFIFQFSSAQTNNVQITMFRYDASLSGQSKQDAIYKLSGTKFRYKIEAPIRSTPAVSDGVIYFGGGDGVFYALNAETGKEIWKFKTGGPIYSSPAVTTSTVYFSSRDNNIYALQKKSGKVLWKFKMGNDIGKENYWDNYLSSPIIVNDVLYIGSGDGFLYSFNNRSGKVIWKYNSEARIRTTPCVFDNNLVFGNNAGYITNINCNNGALIWKFATDGVNNTFESKSNDRKSIYCSASIAKGVVVTGGRDGIIYGIDLKTGKEKWRNDHKGPWILSTAVKDETVYVGCGSDALLQALDINSGKEKWNYKCPSAIFSSITIAGDMLYFNDLHFSGNLHAIDLDGKEKWSFPVGARSFSTPVVNNGIIYSCTENGTLYALQGNNDHDTSINTFKKLVYWEGKKNPDAYSDFQNGVDEFIRDYFIASGYKLINAQQLEAAMQEQLSSHGHSVIVFADNRFPLSICDNKAGEPLVLQYVKASGKIALFGLNPAAYTRDTSGVVVAFDDSIPSAVFGIRYTGKNLIRGIYQSHPTIEGEKIGLFKDFSAISNFTVIDKGEKITPLALDEFGSVTEWIKNFGGPEGTGLLQLNIPSYEINFSLSEMRAAIEYGVCW